MKTKQKTIFQEPKLVGYPVKDKCINCKKIVDLSIICGKIEKVMLIVIKKVYSDKIMGKEFPVLCSDCLRKGVKRLTSKGDDKK